VAFTAGTDKDNKFTFHKLGCKDTKKDPTANDYETADLDTYLDFALGPGMEANVRVMPCYTEPTKYRK
jgi:hypothetical protein